MKYLAILLIFSIAFSHSFFPYDFSLTCPKDTTLLVGKETSLNLYIKNTGLNEDFYNITVQTYPNIYVSPSNVITKKIKKDESISIDLKITLLSAIGGDEVRIIVKSGNMPEKVASCSFKIKSNYFSLGNFEIPKFLIFFFIATLLVFL
jgi:hypothetical protein